jgi:hypothetical protein
MLVFIKMLCEMPGVQYSWLRRKNWQKELSDLMSRLPIWKSEVLEDADARRLVPSNWAGREPLMAVIFEIYMSHPRHGAPRLYTEDNSHIVLPVLEAFAHGYYSETAIVVLEEIMNQNPVREALPTIACISMCAACVKQFPTPPLPASTTTHRQLQVSVFGIHMYNRCDINHRYFGLFASLVADRIPALLSQMIRHGDSFQVSREAWLLFARICAHAKDDVGCRLLVSKWWANGVFDHSNENSLFADTIMSRTWKIEMGNMVRFFHGFTNAIEFAPARVMWRENQRALDVESQNELKPKKFFHASVTHLTEIIAFIKWASPNFDLKQNKPTGAEAATLDAVIRFGQAPMIGQAFHACSHLIDVLPTLEVFEIKGALLTTAMGHKNHPLVSMYRDKLISQLQKIVI